MSDVSWRRRDCVSAELEGALVLLDLEELKYHSLNGTASAIWEILAEPHTTPEIVRELCGKYDVSIDRCTTSVESLLHHMLDRRLVSEGPAEATAGA